MPIEVMDPEQRSWLCDWQKRCFEAGLVGADYPVEAGGGGHEGLQRIANQELAAARSPYMLNIVGLNMAAPTILKHGTPEQIARFIPPILSGEELWCQGFSEPGAGSDLAGAQSSAVRHGDDWIVNGHKVWTSLAHFCDYTWLAVRTSKSTLLKVI